MAVHVSLVRHYVSPQSLTTELSKFGAKEHTSATHVKFSGPKMGKRLSLDSHKKISGKSTKLLYPNTQLTMQLEQSSLVPSTVSGVTHTPSSRARASAPRELLKELVVAHCSLSQN